MLSFLSRHIICPLHERLVGRPTFSRLRELERHQWLTRDEIQRLARTKLQALLVHAARNTRFYARRFTEARIDPGSADPGDALRVLPLMRKADIRQNAESLAWPQAPGGLHPYATGGSDGDPLRFFLDRRRQASDQAARILTHAWFDVHLGERELWVWGSPIETSTPDRLKALRDRLFNQRLLSAFDLSETSMRGYAKTLRDFRPQAVFGYPSTLSRWAEFLREHGAAEAPCASVAATSPAKSWRPRAVFVTGEVCDARQRRLLEDTFSAPVADGYGSREGGFIAHECPQGSMHQLSSEVLVEIVDGEESLAEGQWGEIVVTHLEAYGMPFIRYRTGDWGRLLPGSCACGRGFPLMDRVQGRRTDFIHLPDGTFMHGLAAIYVLRETPGVREFQVLQRADYSLDVSIVTSERAPGNVEIVLRDGLKRLMRGQTDVRVRLVESIPRAASGKRRPVICLVQPDSSTAIASAGRSTRGQTTTASLDDLAMAGATR